MRRSIWLVDLAHIKSTWAYSSYSVWILWVPFCGICISARRCQPTNASTELESGSNVKPPNSVQMSGEIKPTIVTELWRIWAKIHIIFEIGTNSLIFTAQARHSSEWLGVLTSPAMLFLVQPFPGLLIFTEGNNSWICSWSQSFLPESLFSKPNRSWWFKSPTFCLDSSALWKAQVSSLLWWRVFLKETKPQWEQ